MRASDLPVPATVRFSLESGLRRTDLDQLDSTVEHVVIKTARYKAETVLTTKDNVEEALAQIRQQRGHSNEPLLCQDAYFDYDADGLQQTYSIDGFALEGKHYFVSVQRWHKIITKTGIDYCWTEQLDVLDPAYHTLLDHTRTVLSLLGMRNGFFHPEFTESIRELILLDLNPRVAGASGVVDRLIVSRQGAGVVDEFVETMYGSQAESVPNTPHAVRLVALYGMSPKNLEQVSALKSVAEIVPAPLYGTHLIRFDHVDSQHMLTDVRYCLDTFTQTRYGVRVAQGWRNG